MRRNTADDFCKLVDKNGPVIAEHLGNCWVWTGRTHDGYGLFDFGGKSVRAHRFSYELGGVPIPTDKVPDHLCRNRACIRPSHLEVVTQQINILRGEGFAAKNSIATHCIHGHIFDELNTIRYRGHRYCRKCMARLNAEKDKKKKRWLGRTEYLKLWRQKKHAPVL